MALVEREPSLPEVTIDLSTHQFTSDRVTKTIKGKTSWSVLLLLASNPLQKIPIEEISKAIFQAGGRDFDRPGVCIDLLKRLISADNGRPLIAKIRGSRHGGREVLGYSFLAHVSLIRGEQMSLPGMDEEEFSSLYEKQIDKTRLHIYYRVGNHQDAEDLAHEVYYRAWRANVRGSYKPDHKPVPWIHKITDNSLVDYYHYRAKNQITSLEGMDIPTSESSNPAFLVERQLENDRLHWAINNLKREQQMVVRARYIDEMEYDKIAEMMGKSEGAVRVTLHRAMLSLRNLL